MTSFNGTVSAIRAIGAEFARRIYVPVLIAVVIILILLTSGSVYLTTLSAWWWFLAGLMILWDVVFAVAFMIVGAVIRAVRPEQSKSQQKAVKEFVNKLQGLSEVTQTPKFILLFRIVRDIMSKKRGGFLEATVNDTATLRKDFSDIVESFKD